MKLNSLYLLFNTNLYPCFTELQTIIKSSLASELQSTLFKFLQDGTFDENVLRLQLQESNLNIVDAEVENIVNNITKYRNLTLDQLEPILEDIESYFKDLHYKYINDLSISNADKIRLISEIPSTYIKSKSVFEIEKISKLNLEDLAEEYDIQEIKSGFEPINQSSAFGGYYPYQIVMVCAPPGVGKSLFMLNEAVNMTKSGKKVHYLALGDMSKFDILTRLVTIIFNDDTDNKVTISEVTLNAQEHINNLIKLPFIDNLSLSVVPAETLTSVDYVNKMMEVVDDYDVLFIDYDSNFARGSGDNLFLEGSAIYNNLTSLVLKKKLIFIACQPKISAWGAETITISDPSESSRKQHVCDLIITISRISRTNVGYFNVVKNRRGPLMSNSPYYRTPSGTFMSISHAIMNEIRNNSLSTRDINSLISKEKRSIDNELSFTTNVESLILTQKANGK